MSLPSPYAKPAPTKQVKGRFSSTQDTGNFQQVKAAAPDAATSMQPSALQEQEDDIEHCMVVTKGDGRVALVKKAEQGFCS